MSVLHLPAPTRTVLFILALATLLASLTTAAPSNFADLSNHAKLVVPDVLAQSDKVVPGKYIVQFTRPAAANVAAQRRERASPESLERGVKSQHESFRAYVNRNHIPVKVERRFVKLFNGVSAQIDSAQDLKKVLDAPGVARVYPVMRISAAQPVMRASAPPRLKDPNVPQYAHNLTNMHLVNQKYPTLTGHGIKVGVIDSGIDWKHPAFAIRGQKCETFKGPGCRVLYGWDFTGNDYNGLDSDVPPTPDSDPLDCMGHGTHVAGILGGYDDKIKGVAPEVVFGAYRVFGCDELGTTEYPILLAALEQAFQDGMDLVNMSLGEGSISRDHPFEQAIDTLVTNGVHVIASAGNHGGRGLGQVGSPSTASKAISVASFENTHTLTTVATITNVANLATVAFSYIDENIVGDDHLPGARFVQGKAYMLARLPDSDGCRPFPPASFAGTVALLPAMGDCFFMAKVTNALAAGAEGVVMYQNTPTSDKRGVQSLALAQASSTRPVVILGHALEGEKVWNAALGRNVTISFNNTPQFYPSPDSGRPSAFSSWGLDMHLHIRPDVGSPGSNIFSAYPNGSYKQMGGTSMAAPYIAGIVALDVQRNGASTDDGSSLDIARRLSLTARPSMMRDGTNVAESVAKTGAGLVDALAFFDNPVSVIPHTLELGDTPQWPNAPIKSRTLTIKNNGKEAVTYRLTHTPSRAVMGDNGRTTGQLVTLSNVYARVTFSVPAVTLQPGEEKQVTVTINANVPLLSKLPEPGHYIYSGYVTLQSADHKSNLNVPYAVMAGDYGSMPVIPTNGRSAPLLTNGLALNRTAPQAPTYNSSVVPEFSLNTTQASSIPVIRFSTVWPTRLFAVSLHRAAGVGAPLLAPVGYLLVQDDAQHYAETHVAFHGQVHESLSSPEQTTVPDGEYTIGLQYVRPMALHIVADPGAALVVGWMSPKFKINRAKRPPTSP